MSTTVSGDTGVDKVQSSAVISASSIMGALNASGAAPIYACRAWVNFNGTGTVAIRESGNVSSITDNGIGDYTVNFTTAMSDVNFCCLGMGSVGGTNSQGNLKEHDINTRVTTSVRLVNVGTAYTDPVYSNVSIFR